MIKQANIGLVGGARTWVADSLADLVPSPAPQNQKFLDGDLCVIKSTAIFNVDKLQTYLYDGQINNWILYIQSLIIEARVTTGTSQSLTINDDGFSEMDLPLNSSWEFRIDANAIDETTGNTLGFSAVGNIKNIGGVVSLDYAPVIVVNNLGTIPLSGFIINLAPPTALQLFFSNGSGNFVKAKGSIKIVQILL